MAQLIKSKPVREQIDYLIQESIDKLLEAISCLGLRLIIDEDMNGLQNYLLRSGAYPNPSFDPSVSDLTTNAFWLRVEDQSGRVVASHAERIFHCDDFVHEIVATDKLWSDQNTYNSDQMWRTEITPPPIKIRGRVGYAGGMFIQNEHRGSGLSLFLPYLSRSLCMRSLATDWHTGLVHLNIATSPVPTQRYGYPRTGRLFYGRCPRTTGDFREVHLCWMSRAESVEKLRDLPNHSKFPINISANKTKPALDYCPNNPQQFVN